MAVFLSGRPMWVNPEINASDAFIAGWLPGSEGGGIADVLLRKANGDIQPVSPWRLVMRDSSVPYRSLMQKLPVLLAL